MVQQASLLRGVGGARQVRGGRGPATAANAKAAPAKKNARRPAPPVRALRPRTAAQGGPARVSARLANRALATAEEASRTDSAWESGDLGALPLRGRPQASAKEWEAALKQRCDSSKARGKLYDSEVGICCHFCRQKKLCGEPDCPRCSRRDPRAQCAGKSECSRCGGGRGRFYRACLELRYGQDLDEVREQMGRGEWLCPHCYEEEHPEEGWICNSSICMKRRGMAPTGIAIFRAKELGFKSVAHYVQADILQRRAAGPSTPTTSRKR